MVLRSTFRLQMNRDDLHWLAGLLEGEGCFGFDGSHYVRLKMADEDVVRRAAGLMGGRAVMERSRKDPRHQLMWYVGVYGGRARLLMEKLLPLMGARRAAKIRAVLPVDEAEFSKALVKVLGEKSAKTMGLVGTLKSRSIGPLAEVLKRVCR